MKTYEGIIEAHQYLDEEDGGNNIIINKEMYDKL